MLAMSSSTSHDSLSPSLKKRKTVKTYRNDPYHLSGETSESLSGCYDFLDGLWSESKSGCSMQSRRGFSTIDDGCHAHLDGSPSICSSCSTPEMCCFKVNSLASFTDIDHFSRTLLRPSRDFRMSRTTVEVCEVSQSEQPLLSPNAMLSTTTPPDLSCTHEDCVPFSLPRESSEPVFFDPGTPVVIGFKYGIKIMVASFPLEQGLHVIVPGDRDYDCGKVLSECKTHLPNPLSSLPEVIRVTTQADLEDINQRDIEEKNMLKRVRKIAKEINFPAAVLDVMYQLRFTKVTIIIERKGKSFVDFRRLQRAAYKLCHCRVWVAYLDEVQETMRTDIKYCKPMHSSSFSPIPSSFSPFFSARVDIPQSVVPHDNFAYHQLPQRSYCNCTEGRE